MFSREFWRPKTAKVKYILGLGLSWCCFHPLLWWRWWCPLGAGGALLLPLFGCVPSLLSPPFVRFPAFLSYFAFQICLISRFKGVFGGFWGADVCLYGLRSLRGLWGFCVREWLGGFMSCGVFAPIFSFFHLLRISSGALPLLSLACPLGCLASALGLALSLFVGCCCFFFPFGLCAKRKGAPCWCVLSCPVGWVFVLSDYLNKSATYIIFHTCHIVNGYIVTVKSVPGIIEANKGKI